MTMKTTAKKKEDERILRRLAASISADEIPELITFSAKLNRVFSRKINEELSRYKEKPEILRSIEAQVAKYSQKYLGDRRTAHLVAKAFNNPNVESLLDSISKKEIRDKVIETLPLVVLDPLVKAVLKSIKNEGMQEQADQAALALTQIVVFERHPIARIGGLAVYKFGLYLQSKRTKV